MEAKTEAGRQAISRVEALTERLANWARHNDRSGSFATESMEALRAEGILGTCAPVELGGDNLTSLHDLTLVVEHLARADASAAVAAHMHLVLSWYFARTLRTGAEGPNAARHASWCRLIGAREMVVCSAVSERGRFPWTPETCAELKQGAWVVSGRKSTASNSPGATHFYTRVRVNTTEGPRLGTVMIPRSTPGVEVLENWDGLGLRGSGSGDVEFDDCRVPAEAMTLGGPWGQEEGRKLEGRVASTAPLLGVPMGLAESAWKYGRRALLRLSAERPLTGTEIHLASDAEVCLTAARGALTVLMAALDADLTNRAPGTLSVSDGSILMRQTVAAGLVVERAAIKIIELSMQVCGGAAYHSSHDLARNMRDVRALYYMRPYTPPNAWRDFLVASVLKEADYVL